MSAPRTCQACGSSHPVRRGRAPRFCERCRSDSVAVAKNSSTQPELVESWKQSIADGTASERCDELIRQEHERRGIPMRLSNALVRAIERAEAA